MHQVVIVPDDAGAPLVLLIRLPVGVELSVPGVVRDRSLSEKYGPPPSD